MIWCSLVQDFDTVSVRFEQEADYRQVQKTLRSIQGNRPTFWREGKGESLMIEGRERTQTVDVFHFYGDGETVISARFLSGDYPPPSIDGGCVVSSSLCKELWGSQEAIGKKLWSGKREYQVYGIFDSPEKLMLVQQYPRENVEFSAMETELTMKRVQDYLRRNGLPSAQAVVNGPGVSWLLYQLVLLPFYVLLAMSLWRVRKTKWPKWGKISLMLAGALLLFWLVFFPYQSILQMIAKNFTNAAFWDELLRGLQVNLRTFFTLPVTHRDILLGKQMLNLCLSAALAAAGMVLLVKRVVFRYCLRLPQDGKNPLSGKRLVRMHADFHE